MTAPEQFGLGGVKERAQRPTVVGVRVDWETSGGRLFEGVFECTLHLKWKLAYFLIPSNCAVGWKCLNFTYRHCMSFCDRGTTDTLAFHRPVRSLLWLSYSIITVPMHIHEYLEVLFLVPTWPQVATPNGPMLFPRLAVIVAVLKTQIVWQIQHLSVQGESSNCPSVICLLLKKFLMLPLKLLLRWERLKLALLRTATAATLCLYYINLSCYIKQHLASKL